MRILLPDSYGMCFGVRDALAATESIQDPVNVTIYGELVHNERIQARLRERGFHSMTETGRSVPATPAVLITAHGVSGAERARLASAGLDIIDTTCPLVRAAHSAARLLDAEDRLVVVIGKADHVEVKGIVGDLRRFAVFESAGDVVKLDVDKLGVVAQTTTTERAFAEACDAVRRTNPGADVRVLSTICAPTRERQRALEQLLGQVDVLVVVGGLHSRNSRELAETARLAGVKSYLVPGASSLDPAWFDGVEAVGLTAGTSTPQEMFDEVRSALEALAAKPAAAAAS
jgi:4-hydroxy-3-methylbut-2-enyl diphosphate reductase